MPPGGFFAMLLVVLPALSLADASIPNTPAGHVLGAWLDAFNSADRSREESFIKTHASWMNADDTAKWRAETGGYDLLDVYSNDKTNVFFRVKARATGSEEIGRLRVNEAKPLVVTELETWRVPAGATLDPVSLDAAARRTLIERVAEALDSSYVYPDVAARMSAALREHEKRGEYRFMLYGIDLARTLTQDLQEISHDKHIEVRFSFVMTPIKPSMNPRGAGSRRLVANSCGVEKAEHLRPNIGYLKLDLFADPQVCAPTASAAMTLLADSDALILDLRDNHGGDPDMVEVIASYLFDQRTHLNDVFNRAENATREAWTSPDVPGRKFIGKPVFVLTSKQTFSAAEDLSYSLKNLKRATLIGETTLGGAHPAQIKPIDDHFSVTVPYARSISPITKTNWEGTGVEPDVNVNADEALDVALKLAATSAKSD
jgi:hypothetical protein